MRFVGFIVLVFIVFLSCRNENALMETHLDSVQAQYVHLLKDDYNGDSIIIVGSSFHGFVNAFRSTLNDDELRFKAVQNNYPIIMEDQLGNRYDQFGRILLGPSQGQRLHAINCGFGFSFLFTSSFPGIEIYGMGSDTPLIQRDTTINWSVPVSGLDQGNFFDNIKSLTKPNFIRYSVIKQQPDEEFYLNIEDEVICVLLNGELKVYPKKIMYWHETINDVCGGIPICVSYTTLTNSAKVWLSEEDEFGVSGSIYNNNLLAFDRATESYWSQLLLTSVYGSRKGEELKVVPHLETTLKNLLRIESNPLILSDETGYAHNYSVYPWGEYRTNDLIVYNLWYLDQRIPMKETVFGIYHNGKAKIYRWNLFQ